MPLTALLSGARASPPPRLATIEETTADQSEYTNKYTTKPEGLPKRVAPLFQNAERMLTARLHAEPSITGEISHDGITHCDVTYSCPCLFQTYCLI